VKLLANRRFVVLLAALVVLALSEAALAGEALPCPRFTSEDLPQPAQRHDRHSADRLQQINQAVKATPYWILFLGDSLTEGWDPYVWERNLLSRGVLNAGVGGDRTEHLLWRLDHGNLAGPPPKAVVILIGTNDLGSGRSPELTGDGIRANLQLLRERLPETRILLIGLLPREAAPSSSLRRAVVRVNNLIRDCADGEHITYADIGEVLLDSDGRLNAVISPDQLHFSEQGYALLTSQLNPLLDGLLGPAGRSTR
jgi:beta-glucosidase